MVEVSILIADTNPYILDRLPPVLGDAFPYLSIDICDSPDGFADRLRKTLYNTIALSPLFISDYHHIKPKQPFQLLAPLLVTASREHPLLAKTVLETDAFDVIVTPFHPTEAVQTVRLALWQNRLLRLLTAKDRTATVFQKHMATFPTDWKTEEFYRQHLATLDETVKALESTLRMLLEVEDDQPLVGIAASVMQGTKERALHRLLSLCRSATT